MAKAVTKLPKRVEFDYSTSLEHRIVYVDGVRGVITPRHALRAIFFSEHQSLPERDVHGVVPSSDGDRFGISEAVITDEDADVFRIVREQEVTLIFTKKGLADLIPWMQTKLGELVKMEADAQASEGSVQ